MADDIEVRIGAGVSGLKDGMKQASDSVTNAVQTMQRAFSALAIEETIRRAIEATTKFAIESELLGRTMGITSQEASILKDALDEIGSSGQTYTSAFLHFSRQLKMNEGDMRAMGVSTRDANGETRKATEVMQDALSVVQQYRPGLDQTRASMFFFGRTVKDVMELQRLNNDIIAESQQDMERWNLVVGKDAVDAAHRYQKSVADVGNVVQGVQKIIADAVLPIFAQLSDNLNTSASTIIPAVTIAVNALAIAFVGLKQAVQIIWYTFEAVIKIIATFVSAIIREVEIAIDTAVKMIARVKNLDWKGAAAAAKEGWEAMKNEVDTASAAMGAAWDEGNQKATQSTYENLEQIKRLWSAAMVSLGVEASKVPTPGGAAKPATTGGTKTFVDPNEERRVQEIRLAAEREAMLSSIEMQRSKYQTMRTLGEISAEEELAQLKRLDELKYSIELQYIEQLKALHANDRLLREKDEAESAKMKHTRNLALLRDEQAMLIEQRKEWTSFTTGAEADFSTMITNVLARGMTLRDALNSIWRSISVSFVDNMVSKPIAEFAAGLIKQTALYKWFQTTLLGQQAAGAAATVSIKDAEATQVVAANAVEAGSGAAASQAPIPIIGPALAIAAALAMLAFVKGMKSAAGGFDVPSGMNPMTQLHSEEMVLPKELADKVRGMSEAGGMSVTINAIDARSVRRLFMENGPALASALRAHTRNFGAG